MSPSLSWTWERIIYCFYEIVTLSFECSYQDECSAKSYFYEVLLPQTVAHLEVKDLNASSNRAENSAQVG